MKNNNITFYKPSKTLSVSLTGDSCNLDCAHCGGHYLSHMVPVTRFIKDMDKYSTMESLLISGGCNNSGSIEIEKYFEELKKIATTNLKLNFHTGLATPSSADLISTLSKMSPRGNEYKVSFDFLTDNETISSVYGTKLTGNDYIESYKLLRKTLNVIPHVCIGLNKGTIKGEIDAIKTLSELGADKLVLIVFIPTKNTKFANENPPSISDIENVFNVATKYFPNSPVQLGCMRPSGKLRTEIDILAINSGIRHIVMPAKEAVQLACDTGLEIIYKEECCIL